MSATSSSGGYSSSCWSRVVKKLWQWDGFVFLGAGDCSSDYYYIEMRLLKSPGPDPFAVCHSSLLKKRCLFLEGFVYLFKINRGFFTQV